MIYLFKAVTTHMLRTGALVFLALMTSFGTASEPETSYLATNITRTAEHYELNPHFVEDGQSIMFLVFDGDALAPKSWDYRLCKTDLDGNRILYLSEPGVIDYTVVDNGEVVRILRVGAFSQSNEFFLGEEVDDWEVWHLDLRSSREQLMAKSNGRSLGEGYQLLSMDLPQPELGRLLSTSPSGLNKVLWRHEDGQYKLYQLDRNKLLFETEIWQSQMDIPWVPSVCWLNEHTFLTIRFMPSRDAEFPQSEGLFSIVRFDLDSGESAVLYTSPSLHPFPKFSIGQTTDHLFFKSRTAEGLVGIWRLNLRQGDAEILYQVQGDLGQARSNADGSRLLFTELVEQQTDIIRLDLKSHKIERLVSR